MSRKKAFCCQFGWSQISVPVSDVRAVPVMQIDLHAALRRLNTFSNTI